MKENDEWILCVQSEGRKLKRDVGQSLSMTVVGCYRSLYYTATASVDMIWWSEINGVCIWYIISERVLCNCIKKSI